MRQRPETEPADAYVFEKPSKTKLKQQAHDLQALGAELVALPRSRLKDVPMPATPYTVWKAAQAAAR